VRLGSMVSLTCAPQIQYNYPRLVEMDSLAQEQNCYLTTTGRKTGKPHTIEIWFAIDPASGTLYMLSGGGTRSDWVRNIQTDPVVRVRIKDRTLAGTGCLVETSEEDYLARRLVVAKYYGRNEVASTGWEATALPVAVDFEPTV
jgi:deazaflavin-dependent oxidoreductase (nitroreductase family)